jgi:hypothetical protein
MNGVGDSMSRLPSCVLDGSRDLIDNALTFELIITGGTTQTLFQSSAQAAAGSPDSLF